MSNTEKPMLKANAFNKPAYCLFILTGIYFLIKKDFSNASIFWGLAIIFDPFNVEIPFNKRPVYQRIWLILHLVITFTIFAFMFMS